MSAIRHILTTTDFSPASEPGIEAALDLARRLGARVTVLHVFNPAPFAAIATRGDSATPQYDVAAGQYLSEQSVEEAARRALESLAAERLADLPDAATALAVGHDAAETICEWARQNAADLVVMATHGRTGLAHLLIGSVTERVVRRSKVPVLTVPSFRGA